MSGLFITLEGIEGVGKSTQIDFIKDFFNQQGRDILLTREPGGTTIGEAIRAIVLDKKHTGIAADTELLLMFAARAEHLDKVIRPALATDKIVISDRFTDASYAYQGIGRKLSSSRIRVLEEWLQKGLKPDLTILLDAPVVVGLERAAKRSEKDRFEEEALSFFEAVRQCYLDIAASEPDRVKVIDASRPLEEVKQQVKLTLQNFIEK
jgi:dTMP kinase